MRDSKNLCVIVSLVLIVLGTCAGLTYIIPIQPGNQHWQRIEQEGYDAAAAGIPPEACQYTMGQTDGRNNWLKGWQRYHVERKGGK